MIMNKIRPNFQKIVKRTIIHTGKHPYTYRHTHTKTAYQNPPIHIREGGKTCICIKFSRVRRFSAIAISFHIYYAHVEAKSSLLHGVRCTNFTQIIVKR